VCRRRRFWRWEVWKDDVEISLVRETTLHHQCPMGLEQVSKDHIIDSQYLQSNPAYSNTILSSLSMPQSFIKELGRGLSFLHCRCLTSFVGAHLGSPQITCGESGHRRTCSPKQAQLEHKKASTGRKACFPNCFNSYTQRYGPCSLYRCSHSLVQRHPYS